MAATADEHREKIGPPLHACAVLHNQKMFAHAEIFAEGLRKAGIPD
jgi:hypothetical protein